MSKGIGLVVSVVVVAVIFGGIYSFYTGNSLAPKFLATPPSSPMNVSLSFSEPPLLNTPVNLVLAVTTRTNAENTTAQITLPDGFELVSGDLTWKGSIDENEEIRVSVVVKAVRVGYFKISASAWNSYGGMSGFGNVDAVYVEVTSTTAVIGSRPTNTWYEPTMMAAIPFTVEDNRISASLTISPIPELNKEITIRYSLVSSIDLTGYTLMTIVLPPKGIEIIDVTFPSGGNQYQSPTGTISQFSWKGTISENQTVEISVNLKFVSAGWGVIYGDLSTQLPEEPNVTQPANVVVYYVYVDKYEGFTTTNYEAYNSWLENRGAGTYAASQEITDGTFPLLVVLASSVVIIVITVSVVAAMRFRRSEHVLIANYRQ